MAAVVDLREATDNAALLAEANARGITVHLGATVYTARRDSESQSLCGVDIHRIDTQGEVGELLARTDCAVLAMSAGFMPAYQMACQAGAKLDYDDERAAFTLSGLPEGLFLAGSVNSMHSLDAVLADGRNAARAALLCIEYDRGRG